jgi:pectate lyase
MSVPIPRGRRWRLAALSVGAAALAAGLVAVAVPDAMAATLFSANFDNGSTSGWSKSGGSWAIVTDGSKVFEQSDATSTRAREFAGSTSWTNYSAQARVRATSFGSGGVVALVARASGATTMYRMSLVSGGVRLEYMNGSSVTTLASASRTISTSTFYTLRIDVVGSTISGYVDGGLVGSANDSHIGAGQVGLFTASASGRFDDVLVSDSSSGGGTPTPTASASRSPTPSPSAGSPTPTPTSTGGGGSSTGLVGWATQNGGTTGGAGGGTVTVSTLADLTSQVASSSALTIRMNGNFSCSADVRPASNKTILGVGSGSGLTGCGLNLKGVHNVIVRNLKISKVPAGNGNGDAIHIETSTNLWIDHNDLSSDTSHGTDYYDGLLDITHAADYITVSWNILHDHVKCSLVGHSDSNAAEDTGHLRVTYHHNEFKNCAQRNPRVRFANPVHVFNNYYVDTQTFDYSYGIASTDGAGVLVEGNYFENISGPTHLGEGDSSAGSIVARNNYLTGSGAILTGGSVAGIPYAYTVDSASSVKSIVSGGAGTGKITT